MKMWPRKKLVIQIAAALSAANGFGIALAQTPPNLCRRRNRPRSRKSS